MFVTRERLEAALPEIRLAPATDGRLELIVRRPEPEARAVLDQGMLDAVQGLVGDCWRARGTKTGVADPDAQITIVSARAAAAIVGARERRPLAGDQLYVDLDISGTNPPAGTRVQIGEALLEVTALPHTGCGKFLRRFGVDASQFVNSPVGRELNLRGINTRIVRGGAVRTGDPVRKVAT